VAAVAIIVNERSYSKFFGKVGTRRRNSGRCNYLALLRAEIKTLEKGIPVRA
jgi:hypothetical protein